MTAWQQWLQHPEKLWLHRLFFRIHYLSGIGLGLYVMVMSVSGSVIVYRNELTPTWPSSGWCAFTPTFCSETPAGS